MEWKIYNMQGEEIGSYELDDIFQGEVNQPILREAFLSYQTNIRQGTVSTKTRSEVSGGGRKPWPQKGTGRARAGSIRSPLWVGGGTVFGPRPRRFSYSLSKKKKKLALVSSLRLKIQEKKMFIVDELKVDKGKTKEMVSFLNNFSRVANLNEGILLILNGRDEKINRASSNIKNLTLIQPSNVCVYHILSHESIFLTRDSLSKLTERLKG